MKINVEELVEEIRCALSDEFNASVLVDGNSVVLEFENKQKFKVEVKEI